MGKRISGNTQREVLGLLKDRYKVSPKTAKSRILDEFVAVSG